MFGLEAEIVGFVDQGNNSPGVCVCVSYDRKYKFPTQYTFCSSLNNKIQFFLSGQQYIQLKDYIFQLLLELGVAI